MRFLPRFPGLFCPLIALGLLHPAAVRAAGFDQQSYTPSHDTYVQRGAPNSVAGSADEFLVKRDADTISGGSDRIAYLRFTTSAPYAVVDGASLFITINNYAGNGTTPFTFEIFGLPDNHADESFNEATLTFNTGTNATTTMAGSLNPAGLVSLGTFTPAVASGGTRVEFTSTALRDFIAASTNSELTFIIWRQTANAGLPTYFASSEDATISKRPTLLIRTGSDSLPVAATTASSTLAGSAATNATDSDFTTRWIANADTSSTKSFITLDLGSSQTVNRLNFIAYQHGRLFKLESSTNNSTWSLVTTDFRSGVGSAVNTLQADTNRYFQPRTARYFRLTSLTSTTGNSLSLWEVKLYNDPSAAPVLARLASLTTSVAALANVTNAEKLKRVVLELALERAQACINFGDFADANLLLDDAQNNLATPAATMAAAATGLTEIRATRPLVETSASNNPYLARINAGAQLFLDTVTDLPWEKNTPEMNVFADFNLARSTADQMDALLWVFAHPNSGLRLHPEILRRLLRRTYAYLDAINVHGSQLPAGQLASFYDDFAIAPATIVFREFQLLYPGLIPANSAAEWDNAMSTAADNLWAAHGNRNASWVNTDVAIAVEFHNLGRKTGRQELIDKGRYFIDAVLSSGRMFADGAVGYIGTQNEAGGYQGTVESYVNRYYQITGRPQALEILQRMEWYGPLNGPMIDWWTSPSWKHAWNFILGSGQTGESTNGKNPYTRADLDASISAAATATNWTGAISDVGWYERGTTALPRPASYILFDRNIQGPRAWQGGLWNTTATLRAINDSESGHHTLWGAQIMETSPSLRVNASVMGVFPRIRVATGGSRDLDDTFAEARHAWLTSKLAGDSTVTPTFSALGASHKIHVFASSSKGAEHDWTARQVWLNLPDRTIGLLDLAPNANLTAYEVQGAIRLGYGGTAYSSAKSLVSTGANAWSYGNLRVKIHNHNFAELVPEQYTFRVANAPITEITLRDQVGGGANDTLNTYAAGTRWKYITEIRPASTTGEVTVTELAPAGGLIGFDVENAATNQRYRVLYNPGATAAAHTPVVSWPGTLRVYRSGLRFRPDWVPDPAAAPAPEYLSAGQSVTLQPQAHVVLELVPFAAPVVTITSPVESATLRTSDLSLRCTATADTQGFPGAPVVAWSKLSGPGAVTFENTAALDTRVSFSAAGTYQLQCAATLNGVTGASTRTVLVATPTEFLLRQGTSGYSQESTCVRADNPTWNAGARNQLLVGRITSSASAARGLLSFDLSPIPSGAVLLQAALDLTTSNEAGTGTVSAIELRTLTAGFTEGNGSGTSATPANPNTDSGANWQRRTDSVANLAWTNTGGSLGATVLSTIAGYNAASTTSSLRTFASTPDFVAAAQSALGTGRLNLSVVSPLTEAGSAANFTRLHSDDATTESTRPALRLLTYDRELPAISTGSAPANLYAGVPASLTGSVQNAASSLWSLVSGPGTVSFANAASPATSLAFSTIGTYQLRLSAANASGEASATLSVTVAPQPLDPARFADWQTLTWPGVTDAAIIGPNADPDGDSLKNLLEWAVFLDPKTPESFVPGFTKSGGALRYTYTRRKTAFGTATFIVEWSDTLADDWSSAGVTASPAVSLGDTSESVTATVPAGTANARFVRLRVTAP